MAEGPVSNILMTIEESKEKFMHSSVNVHLISQIKHLIGLSLYMPTYTRQNFWLKLSHGTQVVTCTVYLNNSPTSTYASSVLSIFLSTFSLCTRLYNQTIICTRLHKQAYLQVIGLETY